MRDDVQAAFDRLSKKGQKPFKTRGPRRVRDRLADTVGDRERVLAFVCAGPPPSQLYAEGVSGGQQMMSSMLGQVLALTDFALYDITGRPFGESFPFRRTELAAIHGTVRANPQRPAKMLGMKFLALSFDEARGGHVDTRVYQVTGDETDLFGFAEAMDDAVARASSEVRQAEMAEFASVVRTVADGGSRGSVADELGKLAQLRESGVLTDDEFAAQKTKLLES